MTFVSIITITIVLFIALCAGIAMLNVQALLTGAAEKADVVVYVKDRVAADPAALKELVAAVRSFPQVKSATLIDKETSWKRFAAQYGKEILEAVDGNPLPVSLELSIGNGHFIDTTVHGLVAGLSALPGVESVRYAGEWIAFLSRFQQWFYRATIILAIIIAATLFIVISSTISLTIYARHGLVQNMRLVGATRFFIAMPFIVEGVLQGLIGGILAALAFFILRQSLPPALPVSFGPWFSPLLPLVPGALFGWMGSIAAVRKSLQ
jgi:cell division transport system permease protein